MNAPLALGLLLMTAKHCLTCNNYSIELNLSAAYSVQAATAHPLQAEMYLQFAGVKLQA